MVVITEKKIRNFLKNLKIEFTYDVTILIWGINPEKTRNQYLGGISALPLSR